MPLDVVVVGFWPMALLYYCLSMELPLVELSWMNPPTQK